MCIVQFDSVFEIEAGVAVSGGDAIAPVSLFLRNLDSVGLSNTPSLKVIVPYMAFAVVSQYLCQAARTMLGYSGLPRLPL